jgi:hypothetical protein
LIDGMLMEATHDRESKLRVVTTGGTPPHSMVLERVEPEEAKFEDLVKRKPARSSLRAKQLAGITPLAIVGMFAFVALCAASYGAAIYIKKVREQQAFEEMQRAALEQKLITERLENMAQLRIAQAVQNQIRTDTATPDPMHVIRACVNQVARAGLSIGGWSVSRVSCDANSGAASVTVDNRGPGSMDLGTNASLMRAVEERGWTATLPLQGVSATVALPAVDVPAVRAPIKVEQLPLAIDYQRNFATTFQLANLGDRQLQAILGEFKDRGIIYVDPAMDTSQDPTRFKPVPPEKSYRTGTFSVQGNNLWSIDSIRFDQPYLKLEAIEVTVSAGNYQWRMNGAYYVSNS